MKIKIPAIMAALLVGGGFSRADNGPKTKE
jgi:hypothetical protein